MNWESVGALGEAVGAIAVVASLLYVGRQVKDGTAAVRGERLHAITSLLTVTYREFADSERICSLIDRFTAQSARADDFDPVDLVAVRMLMLAALRIQEDVFRQVAEKTLSPESMDLLGNNTWGSLPVMHDLWPSIKVNFAPDFVECFENRFEFDDTPRV
jgi:hypothetical protein